jgi:Glyoxalase/Bleomycin resistance protein/Dioxygenase superfamily
VQLDWGQPLGTIAQFAYVVDDIEREMLHYADRLRVGPWFVRGPFVPPEGRHRGRPTTPTFTVARAFAGHAMVELIQQHDDGPSVYHEGPGERRYGFHHWAMLTETFDEDVARYAARGYEEAFADRLPSGSRVVYVDATRDLPGMIELVEHTDRQEAVYREIYRAAIGWSGEDPIRHEG